MSDDNEDRDWNLDRQSGGMWDAARSIDREAAGGLARVAARGWLRTASWGAGTALRASRRVALVSIGRESAVDLIEDAGREVVEGARKLLGVTDLERRLTPGERHGAPPPGGSLRDRGTALLERSSDIYEDGEAHPAYERILDEMSPDEARILRLLYQEGPQPQVDVRTWRPLGVGSRIVAPGLSMVGQHAGVIRPDRVPHYLSNLYRLGLIWFSRDPIRDLGRYQVLEAQPDVIEAMREVGHASTIRRSVELTPFGKHFSQLTLPESTAEFEAIGGEATPEPQPTESA